MSTQDISTTVLLAQLKVTVNIYRVLLKWCLLTSHRQLPLSVPGDRETTPVGVQTPISQRSTQRLFYPPSALTSKGVNHRPLASVSVDDQRPSDSSGCLSRSGRIRCILPQRWRSEAQSAQEVWVTLCFSVPILCRYSQLLYHTAGPRITPFHSMSFHSNAETPEELTTCLYHIVYGKTGLVICCYT